MYETIDIAAVQCIYHTEHRKRAVELGGLQENATPRTREQVVATITDLEARIRAGQKKYRLQIQNMIVLVVMHKWYPQVNLEDIEKSAYGLSMHIAPDLHTHFIRCMSMNTKTDDEFVNFMRSCVPFFSNPRRVQKKSSWSECTPDTLVLLLRCCLPTLLSLYTHVSCKDVNFWMRVAIVELFRSLILSTHAARCAFFCDNKPLIRTCFSEYIMYYVKYVSPPPETIFMQSIDFDVLFTNAFNIGQQLRMDVNTEASSAKYNSKKNSISIEECVTILGHMNKKCQIMYERNLRYNKITVSKLHKIENIAPSVATKRTARMRSTAILKNCAHVIKKMPYIQDFLVFEAYCHRIAVTPGYVNVLWDLMQNVRTYEVSNDLIQSQIMSLNREFGINTQQMIRKQKILLCLVCSHYNMSTTFRYDSRANHFVCKKCDVDGGVFEIDMLGRVVFVSNIPLYLSPYSNNIVLWSGYNSPTVPEVSWSGISSLPTLVAHMKNMQIMKTIVLRSNMKTAVRLPVATKEFIQYRTQGSTKVVATTTVSSNKCAFCRSASVAERHQILDIYNMTLVVVSVCVKHNMHKSVMEIEKTNVNTFIEMVMQRCAAAASRAR